MTINTTDHTQCAKMLRDDMRAVEEWWGQTRGIS